MSITKCETKINTKEMDIKETTNSKSKNIDEILEKVSAIDNTCYFTKCKNRIKDIAVQCKYCNKRFCISHGLPEIHGCGEALSEQKHAQNQTKLNMKLKQMQLERKSKQGGSGKGKKK
ncbi:hypothetical protein NQ318_022103 [Aromia moschata]|uniref:AN1-type domain-containing protein n=1 Tax=Aromia moschata TaxID=1265417 RepID=A0AAV8Z7A8_9CUCU|nr:hypothetical protein NQ318_022103 [Aromia moschata]